MGDTLRRQSERLRSNYYRFAGRWLTKQVEIASESLQFRCPTPMMKDHLSSTNGEGRIIEWFLSKLSRDCTVWDVGANVGLWALFAARTVGPQGKIIAFEPFVEARELLLANLRNNNISNVDVRADALGPQDGSISLFPAKKGVLTTSSISFREGYLGTEESARSVSMRSGASLVKAEPALLPQALKLDVEGAEQVVLEGFSAAIWDHLNVIAMEVHPDFLPSLGGSVERLREIVIENGFVITSESDRRNTAHWLCEKQ